MRININRVNIYFFIIFIIIVFSSYSCNCGNPDQYQDYPYYAGDKYPAEINLKEALPAGNIFYIDPAGGDITNNGSENSPWSTFQAVIEAGKIQTTEPAVHPYVSGAEMIIKNPDGPVKPGDTIILRSGFHGNIILQDYYNTRYINVIADPGAAVSRLHVQSGCRWRFKGLEIYPDPGPAELYASLVFFETSNWHGPVYNITLDDCTIRSASDSSSWTINDWNSIPWNGISVSGNNMTVRRNYLLNINFGITVSGNCCLVKENTVENFAGDGMRGLGNDLFFEYNTVKNCYDVNGNHDDGFQSWSINDDPPRERVVLRGNLIIGYSDPGQPFRGTLQGIGCFDGWYINWILENNIVITDHWHGITLSGAINCRIVNNTVIDINDNTPGPSWIAITAHKNGTACRNCLIRNNIATAYIVSGGVTEDHNYEIESFGDYTGLFVDPPALSGPAFDLHLIAGASVVDSGIADQAPLLDFDRNARLSGVAIDLGAFERY